VINYYARYTGDLTYEDFAVSLIEEIQEEIYTGTPFCLDEGICGIGWGIGYLVREGFVDGDADFLLEDKIISSKNEAYIFFKAKRG
jgi:hypothetical protein